MTTKTPQAGDDLGRFSLGYISIFLFQSTLFRAKMTQNGHISFPTFQPTLRSRSDKRIYVYIPISTYAPSMTERHEVAYHFNFIFQSTPGNIQETLKRIPP